jgi:hypothetical protein
MKAMSLLFLALCLFFSNAHAQSPFDGTWVIDTGKNENLASEKPRVLSVADGVFRDGDRKLKADGSDQRVPPTGYWDTVRVRIVDDRTVEIISKKDGKATYTETDTVSPDGNTLTKVTKDTTEAEAVMFESDFRRIAPAPAGAHAVSGSWQVFNESRSENSTIIKYKCTSQGFTAETPLGEKLEAKFDGKLYEMEDDPGHTMVSVKLISPYTVEQTNVRQGKVVFIVTLEVTPDGKAIHAMLRMKEDGSVKTWTLHKQSK